MVPIDIAPLQPKEFAHPHSSPKGTEKKLPILPEMLETGVKEQVNLFLVHRLDCCRYAD
jgi:hypothetical protein